MNIQSPPFDSILIVTWYISELTGFRGSLTLAANPGTAVFVYNNSSIMLIRL